MVTGPEYECLAALGTMCMVDDIKVVGLATDLCNRLGMDAISAGTTIAFAMECFEKGLIEADRTEGIDLSWGKGDSTPFDGILCIGIKDETFKLGEHLIEDRRPYLNF
jgi:aldehyde:ferredoxin oxidoreductase